MCTCPSSSHWTLISDCPPGGGWLAVLCAAGGLNERGRGRTTAGSSDVLSGLVLTPRHKTTSHSLVAVLFLGHQELFIQQ